MKTQVTLLVATALMSASAWALEPFVKQDFADNQTPAGWTLGTASTIDGGKLLINDTATTTISKGDIAGHSTYYTLALTFSKPAQNPDYNATVGDKKLVILADASGKILISDDGKWVESGDAFTGETANRLVTIRILPKIDGGTKPRFEVKLVGGAAEVNKTVTAAQDFTSLSTLGLEGSGEADDLLFAKISDKVIDPSASLDDLQAYAQWAIDTGSAGDLVDGGTSGGTSAEDVTKAYILNIPANQAAGVTFKIDSIAPSADGQQATIHLVATVATAKDAATDIDLSKINGRLVVYGYTKLGAKPVVTTYSLSADMRSITTDAYPIMQAKILAK